MNFYESGDITLFDVMPTGYSLQRSVILFRMLKPTKRN